MNSSCSGKFTTLFAPYCPVFREALENNPDDEILVIIPDFNMTTMNDFISLTYGLKSPENVDSFAKMAIFELCETLGMCLNNTSSETVTTIANLEEEVTTEDVERLLNAVEQHQVTMIQIFSFSHSQGSTRED